MNGRFPALEDHFAAFLLRLAGSGDRKLASAARLVTRQMAEGHVCLDLEEFAGRITSAADGDEVSCPGLTHWVAGLGKSDVVGEPGQWRPLILDPPFLYLQRYWQYEREVADFILARGGMRPRGYDAERLEKNLGRLFPRKDAADPEPDQQKEAARKALSSLFCVISGGPGTGKTTTVARILALYRQMHGCDKDESIFLAAPTGKAAARLQEAIRHAKAGMDCSSEVKAAIPEKAVTIHRLLGSSRRGRRYHAGNQLSASLVVVDEASMVDLPLLAWLMSALPADCGLILLGDRNQLASVQPGAVLGDICRGLRDGVLSHSLVELEKSYRFAAGSGIGVLSRAVNEGDGAGALAVLRDNGYGDVRWRDAGPDVQAFQRRIVDKITRHHRRICHAVSQEESLRYMGEYAVLAALRRGVYGVEAINLLASESIASPEDAFFHGRPIMVNSNNYGMQLYNGDTGLILRDPEADNELRAFFPAETGWRKFLPARLPEHETAFALTVHKSQGSEFNHVVLILPAEPSPLLCRELVYTAITRAVQSVEIQGVESVFLEAVSRRTTRKSGLVRALARR